MNRRQHLGRLRDYRSEWPHMSSLYSGGSAREEEEQKYVDPGMMFDNVYEDPSEPYGAYKFYMAPREEFVIQSEPHLYPTRAVYKDDDDRTSGYATSGGSSSFKDGSTRRILLCVLLIFLLIGAIIAAVTMAVLISHQRRMKPLSPDSQQQDVLESNIRIGNRTYKAEHGDPSSKDFRILETEFCEAMDAMFLRSDSSLNEDYKGCKVLSFRYGSVIARYLLMFSWKDKKPTGSIVDTVKDFLQDTIPKIGIWNPLLLDGDSVNIYPVEINEFEPTRKSPEIRLTSDDIGRETVSSSIVPVIDSLSRTASVQINDESTVGVPPEATKKDILSKVSPSFTTISAKTKEVYIMSEFDDNVEKLYSSQSYLMVESEITPSVSLSSKFSQPVFDILLTKSDIVDHLLDDMKIQTTPSIITDEKASIDKSLSLDISLRKDEIENILSGFLPPVSSSSKMSSGVLSPVEIHHPDLEISATPSVSVINIGTGDMPRTIAATPSNTKDASVDVTAPTDDLFGRFLLPTSPSTRNPLGFPSRFESKTVHQSSVDQLLSNGGFGGFLFPFPMRKESSTEILPPNFLMASAHSQFIPYSYSVGDAEMSEHMGKRHQSTLESAMRSSLPVHYPKDSTEDVAILSSDLPTRSKEFESHSSLTLGPEIGGMFENFFLRSSTSLGQEVTEKTPSTELINNDISSEYQLTSQILSNDKYTDTTYILSSKDGILSRYFVDTKTKIKELYSTTFQSTPSTSSESLSFSENNVKSTMVLSSQVLTSRDITKSSLYEGLSSPVPSGDTLNSLISSSVDELPLLVKTADDSSLFSSFSSTSKRLPLQVTTSYYNSLQALLPTDSGSELPIEEFGLNSISLPLLENHLKSDIVDRSREGAPDPQISTHSTKLYSVIQSQDAVSPFSGLIPDISLDGKLESLFDNIYDMKSVFSPIVSTVLSSSVAEEDNKQTLQTSHTASLTQPFDFQSSVVDLSVYKSNDTHMKTFSDALGDVSDLLSTFILEDKQLTNILQSSHSLSEETSSSLTKTSVTPNILNVGFMSTTALTDEKYILPTKSLGYNTNIVVSSHISLSEEISISSDLNPNQLTKSSVLQTSPIPSIADVSPQSEQTMESYASFVTDISTSQSESVYPLTNFDQSSVYSSGVLHQESFPSSTKLQSSSDFSSGSLYTTNPVMSSLQLESTSTSDETSQYASHGLSQKFDEQFSDTVFQNTMDKIYSTALDGIMESAYLRPPQTLTDFESTTPVFASTLKSLQTMISEKSQSLMFEAQQLSSIIDDESSKFDLIPSNVRATDMNDTYTAAMIATTSVLDEMNIMSDGTAASLTSGSVSTQTYLPRSINPDSSHTDEQTKVFMTISNKIENQNSTWSGSYTDKSSITDLDFKSIDITATTPDVSEYEKMTASITAVSSSTVTKEQNMATGFDLLSSIHSPFETFYPRSISSETVEALDSFSINGLMTESPIDTVNSAVHPEATELNSEIVQMPSIGQISTDVDLNSQMFPQRTTDSIQLQSVTASSIAVMNDSFSVHSTSSLFLNDLGKQTNIPFLDQSDLFDASVTEVSSSFSTVMTSQANMPTPDFLTAPSVNKTVFMQSEIDTLISFYSSKEFLNKSVGFDANRITESENDFKTEIHVRDPLNSATWISKSLTNVLDLQPSKLPFSDISSDHVVKFSNSALPNTDSLGLKNDVLTSAIMDSIISTPIDMLPVIVQSSDLTTTSSSYFVSKSTVDHIKDFESQETKLQSHSSLLVPSMYDFSNSSVGHLYDEMQINGSLSMSSLYTTSELPDILSAIPAGKVYETQITVEPLFTSSIHAINTPIDASVLSKIPEIREDILESIAVADPFHSNTVSSSELTSEVSASFALLGSLSSVLLHADNENTATEGVKLSSLSTSYISNHESVTLESGLAPSATDVSHATEILTTTAFSLNSEIWRPDGDIKSETSYPSSVSYIPPIINHHVFSASNIDQSTISSSVQSSLTVTTYPLTKVLTALASSTPELSINSSNSIPFPFPLPSSKYDPSLIETLPLISTQVVPETSSSNLTLDPKINVTRSRFDIIYDTSNFENSSYVKTVHFTASETLNETFSNTFVISDSIHTMNSIEHSLFNTPLIDLYSSIPTFDTISISKSSSNAFSLTPSEENKSQTVHFSDSLLDSFNLNSILMSHTAVNLILSSSLFEFSTVIDDSIPKVKPTGADSAALQTPVGVELNASSTMVSEVQSLTPLVSPYNMSIDSPLEFIHVNSSHDLDSHTFEPNRTEISISPTQMKSYSLSVMNNAVQNQTLLVQATSMDEIKDSVFYVNDHSHSLSIGPQTVDTINLIVPTRVDSQMSSNIRSEILYQTSTSLIIPYEISQDILFKTVKENLSSNINPQILKSETTNLMTKPLSPSHVNSYSLSFMTSAVLSQLPPVQSTSYFSSDAIFFDVNKENSSLEVFNATITNLISPTLMESIITTSNVPYQANDETSTSLIYSTLIESFMSSVLSNEILSQTPPLLNTTYNTSHDLLFDMNKENSTSEIRPLAIGDNSTSLILPTLVESFMPSVMTNEVQTTSLLDTSYDKSHDVLFDMNKENSTLEIDPLAIDENSTFLKSQTLVEPYKSSLISNEILSQTPSLLDTSYDQSHDVRFDMNKENSTSEIRPLAIDDNSTSLILPTLVESFMPSVMSNEILSQTLSLLNTTYNTSLDVLFDMNEENSTSEIRPLAIGDNSTSLILPTLVESFMPSVMTNEVQTTSLLDTSYDKSHDVLFDMNKENSTLEIDPLAIDENSTFLKSQTLVEPYKSSLISNEILSQTPSLLDTSYDQSHDVLFDMNKENSKSEIRPLAIDDNSTSLILPTLVESFMPSVMSNEILSQTPSLLNTTYNTSLDVLFDMNNENSTSEISQMTIHNNSTIQISPTLVESFMPSVMSNEILSQTPSSLTISSENVHDFLSENRSLDINTIAFNDNLTNFISSSVESYMSSVMTNKSLSQTPYSLNTSSDTSHDFLLHMNNDTRSLDISPLTLDNNSTNLTSPNSSLMANETPSQTSLFSTSYNTSSDSLFYMNRENSTLGLGQLVSDDNSMILISPTLVESHIPSVMTNEILSQTPSVLSMSSDNSHDFLYEKRSLDINSNAFDDMSTNLISSTSNELYMPYTMTTEILSQASSVLTTSSDIPHFIDKVSHSLDASLQYVENNNLSNMEPKAISSTQSYSSPIVNIAFSSQFSPYVKPNDIPVTINEIEKVLDTSNLMTNSITPSLIQSELFSKTQLVQAISHDASIFNTVKENNSLDMSPLVFHDNISTYLMNTITPTRVESYSPSLMSSKMLSPTPLLQTTSYDTLIDSLSLAPTLGTTAYDKSNDTLIHENIEGHSLHLGPQIFSVNTTRNQAMTDVSPTRVESVISSAVIAEIPNEEKNSLDLVPDVFDSYTTTYRYPSTEDVSSTQVNLPSVETSEIQSQTPSVETSDIQALSPSVETSEIQSQTPSVENSKIQSQTPSVETSEIQSQTPSVETSEIQSQTPSVETSEIQSQTPIVQTTPYDAFKDFLFKVKEESPSLNLGSQALDTSAFDTSINSTPYLLRSSLFFTLIEESSLHDLAIQSSSYESFQTVQTYSDMTSSQNNENQNISIISQGESVVDSFELFGSLSGGVSDTNVLPNLIVTNILPTRSVKPFDTVWTSHWSSALAPGNLSPITIATDFTHPTPSLGYSSLISVTPYSVLLPKLSTDTSSPTNESDTIQQKVKGSHGSSNFNLSKSLKQNDLMANHALDKQDYYKAVNASDFFVYPTSGMKENVSMNVNGSSKSRIYSPAADIDEDSIRSDILWPFNEFDHLSPHQHFAEDSYIEISLSLDSLTQLSIDLGTDWPSGVTSSSSYAEMHTRLPSAKTFPQFDESLQISNKVFQKGLSRELATDILLDTMLDIGFSSKVLAIPVSQQSSKFPTVISSNTEMQKTFSSAGNFDGPFSYIDDKDTTIKSHNPPLDNTVSTSVSHTPTHSIKGTVFSTSDILSSMDYDTKKVSPISTIPINSSLMHNSHKQLPNSKLSEVGNFIQSSEFVYGAAVDKSEVISTSEKGGGTGSFTNASFALHTQTLLPSLENSFGFIPLSNENKNLDSRPTLTKSSSLSLDILSDRLGSISELSFDRSSINVDSSVSPNVEDEALLLSTENSVNNTYPTQYLDPTNSVRSVFQTQTSSESFFGAKTEDTGNTRLFSSILSENFKETRRIFATSTVTDFDTKSTIKSLSSLEKPFIVSNSDLIHSSKVAIGTTLSQKADRHDGISEVGNHIMSSIVSSPLNRDTEAQLTNTVSEIHISSTLTEKKPPNFPSNIVPSSTNSYTYQSPIDNNTNTKHSQTETSIAALKFPSNINSYTVTKSRSSVNNVLFTAANDYDYYATAYDFVTDNLEDTLSDSVESSSASSSLTSFDDTKSYSDTPPFIPIQPTAISSGKVNNAKIQDTFPSESGVVKGYPIVLDLIKPSKTQSQSQISPKLNSISGETFNPNNHAISSLGFLETPVRMRSSQATQIIKDTIMPSLQRFPGEDVTETTPLGTMIKQSPTSSIISMSSEDPFAAFFGAGPAIPQWVLDMLGSVHESPKSSANYHFRH